MNNIRIEAKRVREMLKFPNFWFTLLFLAGSGVFLLGMPKHGDDYWFMELLRPWFSAQGITDPEGGGDIFAAGIPVDALLQTWRFHIATDNARLANMILTVILLFPNWVGSLIVLLSAAYAMIRGFRLVGLDWLRSPFSPLALALFWFTLPWYEYMGTLTYSFNYVVPTGLVVLLLGRLMTGGHGSAPGLTVTFLLSVVAGAWHEAFALPLICGVIFTLLLPGRRKTPLLVALAGLIPAFCLSFFTPGTKLKAGYSIIGLFPGFEAYRTADLFMTEWVFFVALALIIIYLCINKMRGQLLRARNLWVIFAMCCASLYILSLQCIIAGRVGWLCGFFSIPLLMALLKTACPERLRRMRAWRISARAAGALIMIPVLWSLFLVGREALGLRREMKRLVADVARSHEPKVRFADFRSVTVYNPLMMRAPGRDFATAGMWALGKYFYPGSDPYYPVIVPEALRNVTSETGEPVAGPGGARLYEGYYYMPFDGYGMIVATVATDFGKGYVDLPVETVAFRSEADGRTYLWIEAAPSHYVAYFKPILRIGEVTVRRRL